ncbi:uncharacterized protein CBL_11860 [Carabus blaptoides fortunei]
MMAFCSAVRVPRKPLVVILGSTGTGKTKLSLELAQKFEGEILSADSMQVYTGLDIITAKATKQERSLAQHHLIDIVDPFKAFTVVDFRNKAIKIIDDLFARNKMPIVVGGTNYYIESLLWKILVDDPGSMPGDVPLADCEPFNKKLRFDAELEDGVSSLELHKRLQQLDPDMAKRLHPNNRRKILRSLEVLKQRGRRHSDILREQQSSEGGSSLGGPLRYPDSVIFWLRCDQKILDERLDARVDNMMKLGLVEELTDFHTRYNEQRLQANMPPDYTKGIFQSIGFKEFHEYLILNPELKNTKDAEKLLKSGIENLKIVTRRYARKQIRWVLNRFLGRPDREVPSVYGLDTTDVSLWKENVRKPAIEIIQSFFTNSVCKYTPMPVKVTSEASSPFFKEETYLCDVCERVFVGLSQWNDHKNSKKHKKILKKKLKQSVLQKDLIVEADKSENDTKTNIKTHETGEQK